MNQLTKQIIMFSTFILLNSGPYNSYSSLLNYIHKSHGSDHAQHAEVFFVINSIASISFNLLLPNMNFKSLKKAAFFIPVVFLIVYISTFLGFLIGNAVIVLLFTGVQSIFAGLGSSLIWTISGRYINNSCANFNAKDQSAKYFGIFGGFMACSFLFGSLLSAGSLSIFNQKHSIYIVYFTTSSIAFAVLRFFVKDVNTQVQKQPDEKAIQQQPNLQIPIISPSTSRKSTLFSPQFRCNKSCIFKNVSIYRKMVPLYPYQILSGIISGYIFHCSQDYVFVPPGENKDRFLTVNLIFLGMGGIAGSYLSGYLGDRIKQRKLFLIGTMGYLLSFLMGIISLELQLTQISLITGFLSGATLMYGNNMLTIICSKVYGGGIQTFAGNRLIINMSVIVFNVAIGFVAMENMRNYMYVMQITLIILSIISLFLVKYVRQRQDEELQEKTNEKQIQLETTQYTDKTNVDDSAINTMKQEKYEEKNKQIIV